MKKLLEQTPCGEVFIDGLDNEWTLISKHFKYNEDYYCLYGASMRSEEYEIIDFYFNKDGFLEDVSGEIFIYTLSKKEDVVTNLVKEDVVNSPKHYKLVGDVEVKHVVKEVLDRWDDNFDISSYRGGCMKEAIQYILRAPLKNGEEDIEKAIWYLKEFLS